MEDTHSVRPDAAEDDALASRHHERNAHTSTRSTSPRDSNDTAAAGAPPRRDGTGSYARPPTESDTPCHTATHHRDTRTHRHDAHTWSLSERSGIEDLHDTLRRTQPQLLQHAIRLHTGDGSRHTCHTAPARPCRREGGTAFFPDDRHHMCGGASMSLSPSVDTTDAVLRPTATATGSWAQRGHKVHEEPSEDGVHRCRATRVHPVHSSLPCGTRCDAGEIEKDAPAEYGGNDDHADADAEEESRAVRIATTPVHARVTAALTRLRTRPEAPCVRPVDTGGAVQFNREGGGCTDVVSAKMWASARAPTSHRTGPVKLTMRAVERQFGAWCVWSQHTNIDNCSAVSRCSSTARRASASAAAPQVCAAHVRPSKEVVTTGVANGVIRRLAPARHVGVMTSCRIDESRPLCVTHSCARVRCSGGEERQGPCTTEEGRTVDGTASPCGAGASLRESHGAPLSCGSYMSEEKEAVDDNHIRHWCDRVMITAPFTEDDDNGRATAAAAGSTGSAVHTWHVADEPQACSRREACAGGQKSAIVVVDELPALARHDRSMPGATLAQSCACVPCDEGTSAVALQGRAGTVACATLREANAGIRQYSVPVSVPVGPARCTLATYRSMCARFHTWGKPEESRHGE